MVKNKHVVMAMIVAPILALISYFATDYAIGEKPSALEPGQSYPLVARSNCRYASGVCTLVNGDLEVKLSLAHTEDGQPKLQVYSNQALDGLRLAFAQNAQESTPAFPVKTKSNAKHWQVDLSADSAQMDELRLAMLSTGATFYASVGTDFFKHDARYPEPIIN